MESDTENYGNPINIEQGLRYFGGDKDTFVQQVTAFDNFTLTTRLKSIHRAWKADDYKTIEKDAF